MIWVVDGYNLLHRGFPELLHGATLEEARAALERRLATYGRSRGGSDRIVLVYDGAASGPGGSGGRGVRVVWARPPQSADDVVLQLARDLEAREVATVVTSDVSDIAGRARGLRVRIETSEDFARRVERECDDVGSTRDRSDREKPGGVSPRAAEEWLREFDLHPDGDGGDAS